MLSCNSVSEVLAFHMAVASGTAGPVLARPVLTVALSPAYAQVINNGALAWECSDQVNNQQLQR